MTACSFSVTGCSMRIADALPNAAPFPVPFAIPFMDRLFDPVSRGDQLSNTPFLIYATLLFALAAAFLAFWWMAPDYRAFRSMCIYLSLSGVQTIWLYRGGDKSNWLLVAITAPFLVLIGGESMRAPRRRWALAIWPFSLLVLFVGCYPSFQFLQTSPIDVSNFILAVFIVQAFRRGESRDRQIAIAFTFFLCVRLSLSANFRALTHMPAFVRIGGWPWAIIPAAIVPLGAATLVIFVRDLIQDRREKQRLGAELEAARIVQQVLIPDEIPNVPGFALQSVYRPAGQVGGDFFQILPASRGGVLVVIGDVSGKGMPAAMTVALLVGTVRTLAHYTESPGEILAAMNQRMLTRSSGGFTTCLVLRADADGTLTVANAGHIAPYVGGQELALENGLPLGLSADTNYVEACFHLGTQQQVTLVTDGVVEARDPSGALFGFERTGALSRQPAEEIAQAALAFGQDDDITALTLCRTA
jgi:hypothetical protein